jgi:ferric-dicitrate binding protein FerR (iron transport regulator)
MQDDNRDSQGDEMIGKLIATAGPGDSASPAARERVYAAVRASWENEAQQRRIRNSFPHRIRRLRFISSPRMLALAASVAVAAIALSWLPMPEQSIGVLTGELARVQGEADLIRSEAAAQPLVPNTTVTVQPGDTLETGDDGRLAFRRSDGLELRMDVSSELRINLFDEVELVRGKIYVDSGPGVTLRPLAVETRYGDVEHVGTQYEINLGMSALRLRIREGRVQLTGETANTNGAAGEELLILADGGTTRGAIAPDDPAWNWVIGLAVLAPSTDYRLDETLDWIARELGLELDYESTVARQQTGTTVLSGLDGLNPNEALTAIGQITGLGFDIRENRLIVSN